jgi:hypothetical protein
MKTPTPTSTPAPGHNVYTGRKLTDAQRFNLYTACVASLGRAKVQLHCSPDEGIDPINWYHQCKTIAFMALVLSEEAEARWDGTAMEGNRQEVQPGRFTTMNPHNLDSLFEPRAEIDHSENGESFGMTPLQYFTLAKCCLNAGAFGVRPSTIACLHGGPGARVTLYGRDSFYMITVPPAAGSTRRDCPRRREPG